MGTRPVFISSVMKGKDVPNYVARVKGLRSSI